MWLGPFRSKRSADLVVEALWASTMLRRCKGSAGSRQGPCAPGQMGVAMCPCGGGLSTEAYGGMIDSLLMALERDPRVVLDPIATKMRRLASERRFEEAAQMRDRHRALARSLERARAWQALTLAGRIELESGAGERVIVEHGRLVAAWNSHESPPLLASAVLGSPSDASVASPVPPTVEAAEEAHLIWLWMGSGRIRVLESSGPLALPAAPIPHLSAA